MRPDPPAEYSVGPGATDFGLPDGMSAPALPKGYLIVPAAPMPWLREAAGCWNLPRGQVGQQSIGFPLDYGVALATHLFQFRPVQYLDVAAAVIDHSGPL